MIHNASVEKYRTPVGAVTCGSEMMIRLYDVGQEVKKRLHGRTHKDDQ